MIEQLNTAVRFRAFFTSAKSGKPGLTVTVDVYQPDDTLIVNGAAASAIGQGLYSYTLASSGVTQAGEYVAIFKTADSTVDIQTIPSMWVVGRAGVGFLDAPISSRIALGDDTDGYGVGKVGAALNRLNTMAGTLVVPAAPDTGTGLCRVYGYFETVDNQPAHGVVVSLTLMSPGLTVGDRPIAGRTVKVKTDISGALGAVEPFIDLQRNDLLTPAGSYYSVTCAALDVLEARITLTTPLQDIKAALLAAA